MDLGHACLTRRGERAEERLGGRGQRDEHGPAHGPDVLGALGGDAPDGELGLLLEALGIGDMVDAQLFGDLRRHLRGVAVDRLHAGDDGVVAGAVEQLAFDTADGLREGVGGGPGVGAGEGLVGEQDGRAGHASEAVHEHLAGSRRTHGQEDDAGVGIVPNELLGEGQGVQVERVDDAVEHRAPQGPLLPVPGLLGDVRDVRHLLDEDDDVHSGPLSRGRRSRPTRRQIHPPGHGKQPDATVPCHACPHR